MSRPCCGSAPGGVRVRKATSSPTVTGPERSRPATKAGEPVRSTLVSVVAQLAGLVCRKLTAFIAPVSSGSTPTERVSEKTGGASRSEERRVGKEERQRATEDHE